MQRHPESLRLAILQAFDEGEHSRPVLAQRFGVSRSFLHTFLAVHRPAHERMTHAPHPGGRPALLLPAARQQLCELVAADPTLSLSQLKKRLRERGGPTVSESTLCRAFRQWGLTRQPVPRAPLPPRLTPALPESPCRRPPVEASLLSSPVPISAGTTLAGVRRRYDTDLSDAEWSLWAPLLPAAKPGGRRRKYSLREIVNGIQYVLRTGCAWRHVPHDLPHWEACWHYFRTWRQDGTWQRVHDRVREQLRLALGREATPSAAIIDSQSVKTTEKGGLRGAMMPARR